MNGQNINTNVKITKLADHTTTAQTAVASTAVDMAGFDNALFLTTLGSFNAANTVNLAQGDLANGSDAADLAGSKVIPTANNQAVWLEAVKPKGRYLRLEVDRSGATTTVGEIWCIQSNGRVFPCDNLTTDVIIGEMHITPDEGTA